MGRETSGSSDALSYRGARVLVAVSNEARRHDLKACLAIDGYAFVFSPVDANGSALLILAEPREIDPQWTQGPVRPRLVLLDGTEGAGDDWIAPGAPLTDIRHRVRLNAEIAVLRHQLTAATASASDKVRRRIERLEQGLRLLQEAQRHLERQLAEARDREARRQGGLPPASVLHELKTPLNAISGFAEIMRMEAFGPLGSDKYRDYVETIHQATSHLMDVVNDLMDVYSLEGGQIRMHPARTDLRGTVLAVTRLLSPQAERAGIDIVAGFENSPPTVETDEGRVRQVLINLIGNALKFTPKGGKVSVQLVGQPATGALSVKVRDSGVGISPARLPVVARPYSRGQPGPEAPEGSGLGLSITKVLVEKLGGRLGIESTLGAGTEVTVTLPVKWTEKPETLH